MPLTVKHISLNNLSKFSNLFVSNKYTYLVHSDNYKKIEAGMKAEVTNYGANLVNLFVYINSINSSLFLKIFPSKSYSF